eukprot:612327-Hanusia_phi.AAC.1
MRGGIQQGAWKGKRGEKEGEVGRGGEAEEESRWGTQSSKWTSLECWRTTGRRRNAHASALMGPARPQLASVCRVLTVLPGLLMFECSCM